MCNGAYIFIRILSLLYQPLFLSQTLISLSVIVMVFCKSIIQTVLTGFY